MYLFLHCALISSRLTVISPHSLSRICQLRNSKRWLPPMLMPPLKPSGYGGGILLPMSKSKTNSPQIFLSVRKSLTIGSTKLLSGHRYIFKSSRTTFELKVVWVDRFDLFQTSSAWVWMCKLRTLSDPRGSWGHF
jgi:hypothetical protein